MDKENDRLAALFLDLVADDCNFDNRRHVGLDIALIEESPAYKKLLKEDISRHSFIVYRYFQAFRHLHDQESAYFESIKYDPDSGYKVDAFIDEERYLRFETLVRGFKKHLAIMDVHPAFCADAIRRFQDALQNESLTREVFKQEITRCGIDDDDFGNILENSSTVRNITSIDAGSAD